MSREIGRALHNLYVRFSENPERCKVQKSTASVGGDYVIKVIPYEASHLVNEYLKPEKLVDQKTDYQYIFSMDV